MSGAELIAPKPLSRPYLPLMTWVSWGALEPWPSDDEIRQIAETYDFTNSHGDMLDVWDPRKGLQAFWAGRTGGMDEEGRSLGDLIKQINPRHILSNYRMGSYVQQNCPWEAEEVERQFPLGIAIWNTQSRLIHTISARDTHVVLSPPPAIPPEMPPIYPWKVSTTATEFSKSKNRYVTWLRMADEIIRIEKAKANADGNIELTVKRGYWGTRAVEHTSNEIVFQPVYIGHKRPKPHADMELAGRPDADAPQIGILYALQCQNPQVMRWIGDKIQRYYEEGYDAAWLDHTVSEWYDSADAYGNPVTQWHTGRDEVMTPEANREIQQRKVDYLRRRFPAKMIFVNNMRYDRYFAPIEERRLLSGEGGYLPASGASLELYANTKKYATNVQNFETTVNMTLDIIHNNWCAVAWAKGELDRLADYRQFSYCTLLLSWEPGCKLYFGGGENRSLYENLQLEPLLYWDLGEPTEHHKSAAEMKHPAIEGVYQRNYAKGKVIVYPLREKEVTIPLERKLYDPDSDEFVDKVTIQPRCAKVLLDAENEDQSIL